MVIGSKPEKMLLHATRTEAGEPQPQDAQEGRHISTVDFRFR